MKRSAFAFTLIALVALLPGAETVRAGGAPPMIIGNATTYSGWAEAIAATGRTKLALAPNGEATFRETGSVTYRAVLAIHDKEISLPEKKLTVTASGPQRLLIKMQGAAPTWAITTAVDASGGFQ